jgi:hypothetical protein
VNIPETCRKFEIAPNLYYRWKDEGETGAEVALGGRSAASRPGCRTEETDQTTGTAVGQSHLQIEILKNAS